MKSAFNLSVSGWIVAQLCHDNFGKVAVWLRDVNDHCNLYSITVAYLTQATLVEQQCSLTVIINSSASVA